ncbi:hypothetical protein [Thioalkalivibrio paradoxus]|uniref:hypothetical protein n=1 Tax=Thioalkalivibrio paradoxus TaxID=108010 RepID=UPI000A079594|nr:hypothetical protein [Thioalkalivibrio paradoxus]
MVVSSRPEPVPRAEGRSVIRHMAFAVPRRPRHPERRLTDDGLRPLPPYASCIIGDGHTGHGSQTPFRRNLQTGLEA